MIKRATVISPLLALAISITPGAVTAELRDARALLQQLQEEESEEAKDSIDPENRRLQLAELPPDEAAAQWMDWADEFFDVGGDEVFGGEELSFSKLLEAMPNPSAWNVIEDAIAQGEREPLQQLHLDFLAATLSADSNRQWETLLAIEKRVLPETADSDGGPDSLGGMDTDYLREFQISALGDLMDAFLQTIDDPDQISDLLLRRVKYPLPEYGPAGTEVPDLVTLLGEAGAEELIRQLFAESPGALQFNRGQATRKLARKVALENLEDLQAAPWGLIDSLDQTEFYEALDEKFQSSDPTRHDYDQQRARVFYVLGLATQGRAEEASAILKASDPENFYLPHNLIRDLQATPQQEQLQLFLEEMLAHDPDLPLWDAYFSIAAVNGESSSAAPFIETMLESREWTPAARWNLRRRLADALLSADQVAEGVAMLRDDAREALKDDSLPRGLAAEVRHTGIQIARIGLLLNESAWQREGVEIGEAEAKAGGRWTAHRMTAYFEEAGDFARAQESRLDELRDEVKSLAENSWGIPNARTQLVDVARLYHLAGRPEDVLILLREAPWWGVSDLATILETSGSGKEPIGFIAASALVKTGQTEQAIPLLRQLLLSAGGYDPAYELLAEIDEEGAAAWFDRLFELDPFEERPLIWKAKILRDQGRFQEAKELIEKAIAIDPSDGEQGPGDRMRAYQVLANVLSDLGDEEKAGFYREVVASIRMSEEADALYAAGLRERALLLYQEALGHFADAYCIQSRLARQLQEMGQHERAEQHYRRAFELMPDSFGRVESHCFGCEATFSGERAQSTAERIFARMREERAEQPQVWYLSGYLDFERGRYTDATRHFLRAVELDPNYLNAWSKMASIGRAVHLDRDVRDRAALEILRLDPLQRHAQADLGGMSDLRALWNGVEQAMKRQPERPDQLLALPSTTEFLEQLPATMKDSFDSGMDQWDATPQLQHPGAVLARHRLLQGLARSLDVTLAR